MPRLSALQVSHLRNLHSIDIHFSDHINIIHGSNGSGKTSLLEAMSVLAHGRSFRTRKYRNLIHRDKDQFIVFGRVDHGHDVDNVDISHDTSVGISRNRQGITKIKLNGASVLTAHELAQNLPLLCVNSSSFNLLEGGPIERRMFFDWLVFHVKHNFGESWKQYSKCIKQRNSLLRRDNIRYSDLQPWDIEIAKLAVEIEDMRASFIGVFTEHINAYLDECELADAVFDLSYANGWLLGERTTAWESSVEQVERLLLNRFEKDKSQGFTTIGSHKSDLKITISGKPAGEILSRGQQKVLIVALFFAKAHVFKAKTGLLPVMLLDDLPAELDQRHLTLLGKWIHELGVQVFISSVESEPILNAWKDLGLEQAHLFHVKHGEIVSSQKDPLLFDKEAIDSVE